jgi:hypothetical protein
VGVKEGSNSLWTRIKGRMAILVILVVLTRLLRIDETDRNLRLFLIISPCIGY